MKTFKKFVNDLTVDDIDLINKLSNMCDSEIDDELYEILSKDSNLQNKIEDFVMKYINEYEDFIIKETQYLFDIECIDDVHDYSSGLYNCDELYMRAILNSIGVLWLPERL